MKDPTKIQPYPIYRIPRVVGISTYHHILSHKCSIWCIYIYIQYICIRTIQIYTIHIYICILYTILYIYIYVSRIPYIISYYIYIGIYIGIIIYIHDYVYIYVYTPYLQYIEFIYVYICGIYCKIARVSITRPSPALRCRRRARASMRSPMLGTTLPYASNALVLGPVKGRLYGSYMVLYIMLPYI
jgi:hypothetical protein